MKEYEVVISQKVMSDMQDIVNYISTQLYDVESAKRLVEKVEKAIISLSHMPNRNALLKDEEFSLKGIRRIIVENYVIFYICSEQNALVSIIRIAYNKRNWKDLI